MASSKATASETEPYSLPRLYIYHKILKLFVQMSTMEQINTNFLLIFLI